MSEDLYKTDTANAPEDDSAVHRLLSLAGPRPELTAQQVSRLQAAVRPHWQAAVVPHRPFWKLPVFWGFGGGLVVAAALLAAALGLFRLEPWLPGSEWLLAELVTATGEVSRRPSGTPSEADRLAVGEGVRQGDHLAVDKGRAALRLPSGASVRLDTGTRVRFLAPDRLSLEHGAVYVDSHGDRIEIHTSLGVVEEIGTQFEVRLLDQSLRLRVREGRVVLHHDQGDDEGGQGEELLLVPGAPLVRAAVATHGSVWSWVQEVAPSIAFDDRTLQSYLDWVARETGLELRFSDPALAARAPETQVHGDVTGLAPEETLALVLPACGARHRIVGGVLVVEPLF